MEEEDTSAVAGRVDEVDEAEDFEQDCDNLGVDRVDDDAAVDAQNENQDDVDDDSSVASEHGIGDGEAEDENISPLVPNTDDEYFTNADKDDPAHWRNMKWNEVEKKFEYIQDREADINGVPKVDMWDKVHPRDMKKIYVSFNGGRETMMSHFIEEYWCLHDRLDSLGIEKSQDGLFEYIYGENSLFATTMCRKLDIEYQEFCRFLATVYFAAELRMPASRLEEHPAINYEGYMKKERFAEIWNKIAVVGKSGETDKLWEDLQDALNKTCRELFLSENYRPEKLRIALDDDKVHFHFATASVREDKDFLVGMKPCQHVEAKCRGFTIDSAVASATGFPYHFSVLKSNENNSDNYTRMIQFMFNHLFLLEDPMPLLGATFCSDRGYWNALLMITLLGWGAYIFGTLKRDYWVPYTYDQKKVYGRELINPQFGRSCFQAFCRMGSYLVKVLAFRSGTGAVSLAMNSNLNEDKEPQTFDFCFKSNADASWYKSNMSQEERNLKAFPVGSVITEKHPQFLLMSIDYHLRLLADEKVTMLTVSDLDQVWFVQRKFAWTSSSVHSAFRYSAALIDTEHQVHSSFADVLGYAGLLSLLSEQPTNVVDDEMDIEDDESDLMTAAFVKSTVDLVRSDADEDTIERCSADLKRFGQQLKNPIPQSKMIPILRALGVSHSRAEELAGKCITLQLKNWMKSIQQYLALKKDDATAKYVFPYDNILNAKEVENELIHRIGMDAIKIGNVPGPHSKPTKKMNVLKHWSTSTSIPSCLDPKNSKMALPMMIFFMLLSVEQWKEHS